MVVEKSISAQIQIESANWHPGQLCDVCDLLALEPKQAAVLFKSESGMIVTLYTGVFCSNCAKRIVQPVVANT